MSIEAEDMDGEVTGSMKMNTCFEAALQDVCRENEDE